MFAPPRELMGDVTLTNCSGLPRDGKPRVLLMVIDGWTPAVFTEAMGRGELQTFARLVAVGSLATECTTIFPSITPAATASIITGSHPAAHGVAGMSWLNPDTGQVSYFGDDVATVLRRGPADFVRKFLVRLNGDRLLAPTLMQTASRHGLTSGSINYLIFKGDERYEARMPRLLRLWPFMPRRVEVMGPLVFYLGELSMPEGARLEHRGVRHRFGMDDAATEDFLLNFPSAAALPDFTVAYFADYDFEAHRRGYDQGIDVLRRLDARLARVFGAWGGLERVLSDTCLILTADHSHSHVRRDSQADIQLEALLGDFRLAMPSYGWRGNDEIMVCPNMRAAQVHVRGRDSDIVHRVARRLIADPRVDQVIWRDERSDTDGYRVLTADRGELLFQPTQESGGVRDPRGERWDYTGDLMAVDADVASGEVTFGDYPAAFSRIVGGLSHLRGDGLWVTARPGFEFAVRGQKPHRSGSSHGSLHRLDSLVPLLIAGRCGTGSPPQAPSIVDVEPLCRSILRIPPDHP